MFQPDKKNVVVVLVIVLAILVSTVLTAQVQAAAPAPAGLWSRESLVEGVNRIRNLFAPPPAPLAAAPPREFNFANGISIEPVTAYNLIVDSNVLSPASFGPSAATLGAKFCNTTAGTLHNVWAYIGDYDLNTPGQYPTRDSATFGTEHPGLLNASMTPGGSTLFYLEHESGSSTDSIDASRYIGTLDPGECRTQYWLISYPRTAFIGATEVSVTGNIHPQDDLWLPYHFWATAEGAAGVSYSKQYVTMRNEISAMANKIWPNGDNKVPDEYVNLIAAVVGWDTITPNASNIVYPGQTVTSQGIWYDLGNVGAGFDNNGDLVPDRNAWLQPIGNAAAFDPGCFRLIGTYGLLIVKLNNGTEKLIPFADQMYFENLPANNTGVVGLVFYRYMSLDGACTAGLTPYQEVASGKDNEKFNGDFGAGGPPLQSAEAFFSFSKGGDNTITAGETITYTMDFTLPAASPMVPTVIVGDPSLGTPLVFNETLPEGLQYPANTPASSTLPATILYSTDSGNTWSTTPPTVNATSTAPNNLVKIQWWLENPVSNASGDVSGSVSFNAVVPAAYPGVIIENEGCLSLANGPCFEEDNHLTVVEGINSVAGTVFRDDGNPTGVLGNALRDTGETGIGSVTVSLYYDTDGDGTLDTDEPQYGGPVVTTAGGAYSFTNLPDGRYLVVVDSNDGDLPSGYGLTTRAVLPAALDPTRANSSAVAVNDQNFGFAPALDVTKRLMTTGAVYNNSTVQYQIGLANKLPGGGTSEACTYNVWASIVYPSSTATPPSGGGPANAQWQAPNNAIGAPDDQYAYTILGNNSDQLGLSGYNLGNMGGNITSIQFIADVQERLNLEPTDQFIVRVYYNDSLRASYVYNGDGTFVAPATTGYFNTPGVYEYTIRETLNVNTIKGAGQSWSYDDLVGNKLEFEVIGNRTGGASGDLNLDALGFIVTTDSACGSPATILNPVPLTDTYDPTRLEFVSAVPAPSSTAAGTLTWNNLGPLLPGQVRYVDVTFRAINTGSTAVTTTNTATSTDSRFADGNDANSPESASADVTIQPAGKITGVVWAERDTPPNPPNTDYGWLAPNGYTANDNFYPGATVRLHVCTWAATGAVITSSDAGYDPNSNCVAQGSGNSGAWAVYRTTTTDANGVFTFDSLPRGFYRVELVALVGNPPQVGAPNDNQAVDASLRALGSYRTDLTWGDANANLNSTFFHELLPGETVSTVNFGFASHVRINGNVWLDADNDGVWDAAGPNGEPGISGVTVRVTNCAGSAGGSDNNCDDGDNGTVWTTTTNANGYYSLPDLVPPSISPNRVYRVEVLPATLPSGGSWTDTGESGPANTQNVGLFDGNHYMDTRVSPDRLQVGEMSGPYNFGYYRSGSYQIGDTLFYDWDGDAVQDATDEGIPNVTVYLYLDMDNDGVIDYTDPLAAQTQTGANGNYTFSGLAAQNYIVKVYTGDPDFPAASLAQTLDPDEYNTDGNAANDPDRCNNCDGQSRVTSAEMTAEADLFLEREDFGYQPVSVRGSIGDTIFKDNNGNGVQNGDDAGIAGVTVELQVDWNNDGSYVTIATDMTDASGNYLFENLPAGSYRVLVQLDNSPYPNQDAIPNDAFGSDYTPSTGTVSGSDVYFTTMLTSGSPASLDNDFGFTALAALGDTIYWDSNGNGTQDSGEPGIPGVTVQLFTFTDTNGDSRYDPTEPIAPAPTATTTTGPDGRYLFTGINVPDANGTPYLAEVLINGVLVGRTLTGDPDADGYACTTDPDPFPDFDPLCDSRTGLVLYPGGSFMGADFGYQPLGVIGDSVWLDSNANGLRDTTESGLADVTVRVYVDTNGNGSYDDLIDQVYDDPGTPGVIEGEASTDLDGYYLFENLPTGAAALTYFVKVDITDPDFPFNPIAAGNRTYDPDGTLDDWTAFVIEPDGTVSSVGGCSTIPNGCDSEGDALQLDADFGYQYSGSSQINGSICLDSIAADGNGINETYAADPNDQIGVCGVDADDPSGIGTGEAAFENVPVYLYRWNDDGDGSVETAEVTLIASTLTDASGDFAFASIPDNFFYIVAAGDPASGLELTTQTGDSSGVGNDPNEAVIANAASTYQAVQIGTAETLQNVDFAYKLTDSYDFGDLPESYTTTLGEDGARHKIVAGSTLYLGSTGPDGEENGIPGAAATGDDSSGVDDEDGAAIVSSWTEGAGGGSLNVIVNGSGYLIGWIDFDRDGTFTGAGEMVINQAVTTDNDPAADFTFDVPAGTFAGGNYSLNMRLRLFSSAPLFPELAFSGPAVGGEVEDYALVVIVNPAISLTKSATPATYGAVGEVIHYSLVITNTGNVTLSAPFTVSDPLTTDEACPAAPTSLAPGESITCTASYTITQADLDSGTVTNTATASVDHGGNTYTDTDTTTVTADQTPAISLTKSATPTTYGAVGEVIAYSLVITNTGNVTLNAPFTVSDALTTDESCPATPTSLAPGESITCTASYTITQADLDSGSVTNTATASVDHGGNTYTDTDTATVTGTQNPAISLTKSATPTTYGAVGEVIHYNLVITNTGNVTLSAPFTVSDPLTTDEACPATPTSLAPGESITCTATYTITQADLDNGAVTNFATASVNHGGNTYTDTDTTTVIGSRSPALALEKTASPSTYNAVGDLITYSYLLTNTGNVTLAAPFTVTDDKTAVTCPAVPASLAPNATLTCTATYTITQADLDSGFVTNVAFATAFFNNNPLNSQPDTATVIRAPIADDESATTPLNTPVSLGDITIGDQAFGPGNSIVRATIDLDPSTPGQQTTFTDAFGNTWTVDLNTGEVIFTPALNFVGTATIPYTVLDAFGQTATANLTVTIRPAADLQIIKTAAPNPAVAGQELTYILTVTNLGPSEALNVEVTDSLPASVDWMSTSGDGWTCTFADPTVTCTRPSLPAGTTSAIAIRVMVHSSATGMLFNTAAVITTTTDQDTDNNSDSETIPIDVISDLEITKTVAGTYYIPGNTLTYTLTVINHGPSDSVNTVVEDNLPDQVRFVSADPAPNSPSGALPLVWNLGTLMPGQTVSITLVVQVKEDATGSFINTASVSSDSDESTWTNNDDDATIVPALPTAVGLLYFRATPVNATDVLLEWAMASSLDAFGYKLFRAETPDFAQAVEVGFVASGAANNEYQFTDSVPKTGWWHYWLVKVTTQGGLEVSEPAAVWVNGLLDPSSFHFKIYIPVTER